MGYLTFRDYFMSKPINAILTTQMIRRQFLDFFISKDHAEVASSSLVPVNDPTLLFTNAGMNQFKDTFLGIEQRPYTRATSSQRCVRAGGKHNDLENVGFTARHHTFFEMLGNFSFGAYFKEKAIIYAWELLTDVYKLPPDKLTVTVYHTDNEAYDIWKDHIGIPEARIIRIGDKDGGGSDNFWQMGDTGPCGPCSEIFYDHGADIFGGPPGSADENGDRFIEIWNLVFMQFNRDDKGVLQPLPKPSVDTGMGLERLAAVLQHVHSNYEIDLFENLIKAAAKAVNTSNLTENSLKVIADHIRSVSFLICDGIIPANEGRGYVLRRIIRRAIRHGYKLGQKGLFLYTLVQALVEQMGDTYLELKAKQSSIENIIKQEEQRFTETLENGLKLLALDIAKLNNTREIAGATIFKLYDTYGFPVDLTNDIAREQGLSLDMAGFEEAMALQRNRARAASNFNAEKNIHLNLEQPTDFIGYTHTQADAKVIAIFKENGDDSEDNVTEVSQIQAGDGAIIVLDQTPFYAESGGQVGDTGYLATADKQMRFDIGDTKKQAQHQLHFGILATGTLKIGDKVLTCVDKDRRQAIELNHSATHLLHKAMRDLLGTHIEQKGSLVDEKHLRFDFSHLAPVTENERIELESRVNQAIRDNYILTSTLMNIEKAKERGAMALFGEKYGTEVRVIEMGESIELCGGTHIKQTGEIGLFRIISETGVASGIRRIEALTGKKALEFIQQEQRLLSGLCEQLKSDPARITQKLAQTLSDTKSLEKAIVQVKNKLAIAASTNLVKTNIHHVAVVIANLPDLDAHSVREAAMHMSDKIEGIALIASVFEDKICLAASVYKPLSKLIKAGDLVNVAANIVGGKGGGRPEIAIASGIHLDKLKDALEASYLWLNENIKP